MRQTRSETENSLGRRGTDERICFQHGGIWDCSLAMYIPRRCSRRWWDSFMQMAYEEMALPHDYETKICTQGRTGVLEMGLRCHPFWACTCGRRASDRYQGRESNKGGFLYWSACLRESEKVTCLGEIVRLELLWRRTGLLMHPGCITRCRGACLFRLTR